METFHGGTLLAENYCIFSAISYILSKTRTCSRANCSDKLTSEVAAISQTEFGVSDYLPLLGALGFVLCSGMDTLF